MARPFIHQLRVRFGECDPQGVVFNPHYLAYMDVAMTELWRAAMGSYDAMVERGVDMVVAETSLRFLAGARFDDELELAVSIERLGRTSLTTRHRIERGAQQVVDGTLRHVFVEAGTTRKTEIPAWVREALAPWAEDARSVG
jgi:acyl-CoA thioester hydrolase